MSNTHNANCEDGDKFIQKKAGVALPNNPVMSGMGTVGVGHAFGVGPSFGPKTLVEEITAYGVTGLVPDTSKQHVSNIDQVSPKWIEEASKKKHAYSFLEVAVKEMKDRAAQRDKCDSNTPGIAGERSMAATIRAFNALTGHNLTEAEGWEFMILLKLVRGRQGAFRMDDYVDAAAYCGLLGECESQTR